MHAVSACNEGLKDLGQMIYVHVLHGH